MLWYKNNKIIWIVHCPKLIIVVLAYIKRDKFTCKTNRKYKKTKRAIEFPAIYCFFKFSSFIVVLVLFLAVKKDLPNGFTLPHGPIELYCMVVWKCDQGFLSNFQRNILKRESLLKFSLKFVWHFTTIIAIRKRNRY